MKKHLEILLLQAVNHSGTYEPDDTLLYIEEQLTPAEYKLLNEFLTWCAAGKKRFGHGNIQERFREFKNNS